MKRLIVLSTVLMLVVGGAVPAYADHGDAVDGVWRATDLDGSQMTVEITEHDNDTGYFTVLFKDSRATGACTPAARMEAITTVALYGDTEERHAIFADFSDIQCFGNSIPTSPDGFHYEWDIIVDNEIMVDWQGIIWYHVQG